MKIFKKEYINNFYTEIDPILRQIRTHFIAVYDFYEFFKIFHPSGSPPSLHLLRCRAFAVAYYSFTPCVLQLRRNR
jgi:hypothetical protein